MPEGFLQLHTFEWVGAGGKSTEKSAYKYLYMTPCQMSDSISWGALAEIWVHNFVKVMKL